MASADTYRSTFYKTPSHEPIQPNWIAMKDDISDTGGSNHHLAESGDKVYLAKVPRYTKPLYVQFKTEGLDTNATPTLTVKLMASDGGTPVELVPATLVGAAGVLVAVTGSGAAIGDRLVGATSQYYDIYLEATAATATTGTADCNVWVIMLYAMDPA